jgi:hypothetical protein
VYGEPSIKDSALDASTQVRMCLKAVSRFNLSTDFDNRGWQVPSPVVKSKGPVQRQVHPVETSSFRSWNRVFTADMVEGHDNGNWEAVALDPTMVISWKIEITGS